MQNELLLNEQAWWPAAVSKVQILVVSALQIK